MSTNGKTLRGPWPGSDDGGSQDPKASPTRQTELPATGEPARELSLDELADGPARARVRTSLDESLLVEAAAGTGKTTELIHRVVAVLSQGRATVDGIVAVTFTRKAAGELKLRLRQELDRARARAEDTRERACLEHAVAHLEEARIGTIHSFCAEILRRLPVAAGVDPAFLELSEDEAPALHRVAFERWIQERLQSPSDDLRRALVHLAVSPFGRESVLDRLRQASWGLADWRDFRSPWTRPDYDRDELLRLLCEGVERLAGWTRSATNRRDPLRRALEPVVTLQTWIDRRGEAIVDATDELEARLIRLHRDLESNRPRKGAGRYGEGVTREQLWDARAKLLTSLEALRRLAHADLAASVRDELEGVTEAYTALKRARGSVDYADLLLQARNLVRGDAEARALLQGSFTHLFVDEFQDTDPLQTELLLLLCADDPGCTEWQKVRPVPGKLFVVGDPKQSIYRFRRADIGLYAEVKDLIGAAGVPTVHLVSSFRSVAPIQKLVNRAFEPHMDGDRLAGRPEYVPLEPVREGTSEQPSVVVLPPPAPYGVRYVTARAIEACQPAAAAGFVDWLVRESGWTVEDPEQRGSRVPVRPEHICLLFRRFLSWGRDTTREYTRALEARGIPHLLVGARTLHQREEVETLRSVMQAVEWPNDDLALYATLRGSLFAFSDELLLRFRDRCGRLDAFRTARYREALESAPEETADLEPLVEVLELVRQLHARRNHRPIVETVRQLLAETRAHAAFAMRPAGHQVLANVERVLDLARGYELGGGRSFRGFVDRLEGEASSPRSSQPLVVEDGAPGVRLMTVHNAKGLEFPVVLLADMTANLAAREPDRTIDASRNLCASRILGWTPQDLLDRSDLEHARDASEGVRVAYVAATRARDLLVVPGVGDEAYERGWVSPLNHGVYPSAKAWRKSDPAPGCPAMGRRSVAERPIEMEGGIESSVKPGLHTLGRGKASYGVVWWDPQVLQLDVEARFGLRQEQILSEDEGAVEVERNLARYRAWEQHETEVRARGAAPTANVLPVTEIEAPPPSAQTVRWETTSRDEERPAGMRFGSLVHEVLQLVETDPTADAERLAAQRGRLLEATEPEVRAAVAAVRAAQEHPLLAQARESPRVCREMPFTLVLSATPGEESDAPSAPQGNVMEGTVDLAFLDDAGAGWTVVDFKTDLDVAESAARYEQQVSWYCYALERLTGIPARGVLLLV